MDHNKKLLFINTEVIYSNIGPKRKSRAQLRALSEIFSVEHIYPQVNPKQRWVRAFCFYILYPFQVIRKAFKNKGAIIYYRYYPHCLLLNWLLLLIRHQNQIYVEINTKQRDELRGQIIFSLLNFLSEKFVYKTAYAILVITPEVGEYVHTIDPSANIIVIGNGYDPAEIELDTQVLTNQSQKELENLIVRGNGKCRFIWVGGIFKWDGLDKIFEIVSNLPFTCLYLVGDLEKLRLSGITPESVSSDRIFFLGWRNLRELEFLYSKCDFGLGTFNLEVKNQRENPPLKVREYLYYGLPVIIGHIDPQLQGVEYVHQYKNMDSLLEFLAKPFDREKIKQYARDHLSWRVIMKNIFKNGE